MIEKPKSDSGSNSPNTTGGGNASPGMPSPGASPPAGGQFNQDNYCCKHTEPMLDSTAWYFILYVLPQVLYWLLLIPDFVTPLKKRRMARESVDTPQSAGPSSSSPSFSPMVKQAGELEAQSSEVHAPEENKPFSPIYTPSIKVNIIKELMRKIYFVIGLFKQNYLKEAFSVIRLLAYIN